MARASGAVGRLAALGERTIGDAVSDFLHSDPVEKITQTLMAESGLGGMIGMVTKEGTIGTFFAKLFSSEEGGARTAAQVIAENRAAGKAAEALAKTDLIAQGNIILGSQVFVQTSTGLRVIDHLIQTPTGQIIAIEVKSGNAIRNAAQIAKDAEIGTAGGIFVGKNAPAALRGRTLVVPTIEVRY